MSNRQGLSQHTNKVVSDCTLPPPPQEQLPDKSFNNMTTDWNDGILVAALVDAMAPGLCPEAVTMDPSNALQNANSAMKLADDWLGIPQVSSSASYWSTQYWS